MLVCAPPELRTTTSGLPLPGAVTDTDVSDPEPADAAGSLTLNAPAAADASAAEADDVCAPPELSTTDDGLAALGADSCPAVDGETVVEPCWADDPAWPAADTVCDSDVADSDCDCDSEVDESVSVGSAHATPGVRANAAPIPNAAANKPTRPIWPAYSNAKWATGSSACPPAPCSGKPSGSHASSRWRAGADAATGGAEYNNAPGAACTNRHANTFSADTRGAVAMTDPPPTSKRDSAAAAFPGFWHTTITRGRDQGP